MSTEFHTSASAMSGANNDARRSGSASTTGFGPMAPRASAGSAATAAAGSGWGGHATSPPPHSTMGRRSFGTVFSSSAKRLFGQLVGGGGGAHGGGVHSSASAVTMPLQDGVAAGRPAVRGAGAGAIGVADGLNWRGGGSTTEQVARTFEGGAMQQPSPMTAGAAAAERMGGASNGGGAAPSGDGPDSAGARGPVSGSAGLSGSSSTIAREHANGSDGTSNTGAGSAQAKSSTAGATVNNSSRAGSKGGNLPTTRGAAPRVPPSGAKGAARGSSPSRSGSWADARRVRRQQQRVAAAERAAAAAADGAAARRAGLAGDGWLALYEDMTTGKQYMLEVSYVVLATGLYATPFIPSIPVSVHGSRGAGGGVVGTIAQINRTHCKRGTGVLLGAGGQSSSACGCQAHEKALQMLVRDSCNAGLSIVLTCSSSGLPPAPPPTRRARSCTAGCRCTPRTSRTRRWRPARRCWWWARARRRRTL